MHILLISGDCPYPIVYGGDLRTYNLFKAFAKRNRVTLLCQPSTPPKPDALAHLRTIFEEVVILEKAPKPVLETPYTAWHKLRELWTDPAELFFARSLYDDVLDTIHARIEEGHFDGVYVIGYGLQPHLEAAITIPVITDLIDDPALYYRRNIRDRTGVRRKVSAIKFWLIVRRFERKDLGKLKEVVLVSPKDAGVFHSLCPKTHVTVIPNGVDANFFKKRDRKKDSAPRLIFTGVMRYGPNRSAMIFFCRKILPLIQKQIPRITLQIVGRYPDESIKALAGEERGIEVTGAVEDIRQYYENASVYVCPLRSGAGIKNKILEAWAMETPVVATSLSCEGINVSPGTDILVADRPKEFSRKVIDLLADENLRQRLAKNGREKIEIDYSWDSQAAKVEQLFERLIRGRSQAHSIS